MDTCPLAKQLRACQGQFLTPSDLAILKKLQKEYLELELLEKKYEALRQTAPRSSKKLPPTAPQTFSQTASEIENQIQAKLLIPVIKRQRKELFKKKIYPFIRPLLEKTLSLCESFQLDDAASIEFHNLIKKRLIEIQSLKIVAPPQYWLNGLIQLA
ncbi:MAG: hypothetical protein NZM04_06530 [Methylacidiphilales bacterium]|nr:hypothetical protein [Candidatus Methylacidiphilales bacterium]MDW8349429.1 hypothetical protein [Verrucomicrobiae bacterium]